MKYVLAVEVKLIEMPEEPEPIELPRPGDDPGLTLTKVMNGARGMFGTTAAFPAGMPSPGFDFRRTITISVSDFRGLSAIIEKFDSLAHDIELGAVAA